MAEARLPTDFGEFRIIGYRSLNSNEEFVVLVQGELRKDRPSLVRIHSNNPEKIQALEEMGLKVVECVSVVIPLTDAAKCYLRTKKEKMDHLLEFM